QGSGSRTAEGSVPSFAQARTSSARRWRPTRAQRKGGARSEGRQPSARCGFHEGDVVRYGAGAARRDNRELDPSGSTASKAAAGDRKARVDFRAGECLAAFRNFPRIARNPRAWRRRGRVERAEELVDRFTADVDRGVEGALALVESCPLVRS